MANTSNIILHSTPVDEFRAMIKEVVSAELKEQLPKENHNQEDELFSRGETARKLGVSLPTLHNWTKLGVIQGCRIGGRVRYRKQDISNALQEIRSVKYQRKQL